MKRMLGIALLLASPLSSPVHVQAALIGTYVFDGDSLAPSSVAGNVTLSNFGYSGSATPTFPTQGTGKAYSASGWPTNTTRDDNFNFTITIDPNFQLAIESVVFEEQRSGTGPVASAVTIDGTDLELFTMPDDTLTRTQTADQNSVAFSQLTGTVVVRFFGTSAESGAGTWRLDNVTVSGTLSAVPEPAQIILVGGAISGVAAFGFVRRISKRLWDSSSRDL